jgi:site-specific DNA-methyltransferase (adenine-specific)
MTQGKPYTATSKGAKSSCYNSQTDGVTTVNDGNYYPRNLISIPADERGTVGRIHPTQKPIALMEYMLRTYSNEEDIVLDNTMGSGTTGVACMNTRRFFIGIENDPDYFDIASNRISSVAA